jgi:hypothetical protein
MRTKRVLFLGTLTATLILTAARAADRKWMLPPETATFKPGPGSALATDKCLLCHSADYIGTQPPLSAAQWKAIVTKMREKFGAPIPPENVDPIVDYLSKTYGK